MHNTDTSKRLKKRGSVVIEPLESRLLFSATTDIALLDDGASELDFIVHEALTTDLSSALDLDDLQLDNTLDTVDIDLHESYVFGEQTDSEDVTQLVFVDTSIEDYQALVDDIIRENSGDSIQVITIDTETDGIEQITQYLEDYSGLNSVHIVSHGSLGQVELGSTTLSDATIDLYDSDLQSWGNALSEHADILFYGCNIASSENGLALIGAIAQLTRADVAASDDLTGDGSNNGDWDLESSAGEVTTATLFNTNSTLTWSGLLATPSATADTTNVWIGETITGNVIDGTGGTGITADTLGDGTTQIASVTYDSVLYDTWVDDQLTITADSGTFVIERDGTFTYTATADGVTASPYSQPTWMETYTLYGFEQNVSHESGGNLSLSGYNNSYLYQSSSGLGMISHPYSDGIDFTWTGTSSEVVVVDLGAEYTNAQIALSNLDAGEIAYWEVYGDDFVSVANSSVTNVDSFTISEGAGFRYIAFTADEWDGVAATWTDYRVFEISAYQSTPGDDVFTYTIEDDSLNTSSNTLTVSYVNDNVNGRIAYSATSTAEGGTATAGAITDSDVAGTPTYQWIRSTDGNTGWENIEGATSSSYTMTSEDVNQYVRVEATYTDGEGTVEQIATYVLGPITNTSSDSGSITDITGTETELETLTAGTVSDSDTISSSISYQWQRSETGTGNWTDISGATSSTYQLEDADSSQYIRVTASYTDSTGDSEWVASNATGQITDINQSPVLGADDAVNIDENTTTVGNYAATDPDASDTVSYSLSGDDSALFTIDASGNLAFATSRNFETYTDNDSNGIYEVTITATDDGTGNLTDTQNVSVTIDDVNENPVLGADDAVNIDENTTAVGNYAATDVDAGQTISYTLSGDDSGLFTIDTSGNLAFSSVRDFETYTDNNSNGVYEVTITATDDGTGNLTDTQNVSVTIDDVNENPVLGADDAVNIDENTTAVGNYAATDVDSGQTISYSLSGADSALFTIDASGNLAFSFGRDFETYTDNDSNGVYEVTITATDNGTGNLTDTQNVSVTIDDVNENPVLGADAAVNVDENTTAVGNYAATDEDAGQTISYSLSGADAALFTIDASGNLAFASSRDFETYTDNDSNGVYEVTITATDDGTGSLTDTQNVSVTIDDVNENPVLGADAAVNIDENTTTVGNYAATDVDAGQTISYSLSGADSALFTIDASGNLAFATSRDFETYTDNDSNGVYEVTITATDDGTGNLTDTQNVSVTIDDVNENPVLGADDAVNIDENTTTVGNYAATDEDAGQSISYSLSGADAALFTIDASGNLAFATNRDFETYTDNDSNGVYEVTITATDNGAGNLTDSQNVSVTIDDVNENPVMGADAAVNIDENTTAVGNYAATDVDAGQSISYGLSGDDSGLFTIDASGNLAFSSNRDFETYTDNDSNGVYEVTITATDNGTDNLTDTQNISVTIDDVNENPVLGADAAVNIDENTTAVGNYAATDVDAGQTISYSLSGDDSGLFTIDASGNLAFATSRDFETYSDNDSNGVYEVTITATDNGTGNLTDTQNVSITIDDVNENPILGADAAVNVDENSTTIGNYAATDVDSGQTISYSLSGDDSGLFTIDASGNLAFSSSRDFETYTDNDSNGVYEVTITATDNGTGNLTDTQNVSVTIDDVNENPVLGSDDAVNIDENTTAVGNYAATDVDAGQTISYSLSGVDSGLFTIDASGNLAFSSSRDFETYTDNDSNGVYEVTITASDNGTGNLTDTQNVSVTIDDVNENPVLGADAAVNIDENATEVGNYAATDEDSGQTISYSLSGDDSGLFTIDASGNLAFSSSRDFESYTDNDSNGVYEVTITATDNGTGNLTDTQNVSVTIDDVNENPVLGADAAVNIDENTTAVGNYAATDVDAGQTISYSLSGVDSGLFTIDASGNLAFYSGQDFETYTDNDSNGVYEVTITATDSGSGNLTATQNVSVTIDDVNENPILGADATVNVDENTTAVGNFAATDEDSGQTISYSLSGDDSALFTIDASGNLVLATSRDFETYTDNDSNGVYEVTITATDDGTGNLTDTQNVSVSIDDVNENPVLGADDAVNINENSTAVGNYAATDVDAGQTISYSLAGDDSGLFTIDASGNLAFATSRDFETYSDNDSNGVYEVTITAADNGSGNLTDTQNVSVTIDDVNENPVLGADVAVNINENSTAVGNYTATDVDAGQTISYSLSGDDSGLFTIDASGNLAFSSSRDFETYTDNDSNGVYEVTITATDNGTGNLTDTQNVSVTIADVNENPVLGADVAVNINENSTAVGNYTATDVDAGQSISYSLSGDDSALFTIDASGNLAFATSRDFETYTDNDSNGVYELTITASDNGTGNLTDTQNISVTIDDVNENPVLGADAAINIEENTTTVGNYAATDEDSGQTISYSLSGDDSALFTIDTSGNLSFISGRDFETYTDGDSNGIYEVTVTATDDGAPNLSDMQIVSITITDNTNEFSISSLTDVSSSIDSVSEGAINGTFAGIQAYASDNDGSDTVTYSLLDNATGRFGIDSVTGNVFVLDNTLLDFEQNSSHQINVQATSSDGSFSSQSFTINIENANELGVLTIPNDAEEDQLITASVTDQDGLSNTVNFTWQRSADGSTWFDITGATSSSYLLGDDDAGQYVRVTAQYVDDGGFTESIAASLLTPVANVNDAANVSVAGIASQNQILTASVSDQDGITNPINFQWQASIDGLQWSNITNANSSQLQLTNTEVGALIRVAVNYTDDQGTLETVTSNATEAVLNVNDAPTLATPLPDYNLNEDALFVISIEAETFVDIDGDPLSLTATLADGSPLPVWLQFNSLTNELSGTANASQIDDYEIRITASDSQNLTAEDQFILVISAVNDTPIALYAPTVNNIEDGNADIVDLRSVFSDEEDSPDNLSYNILNNSNENLFSSVLIDATTGELIINYAPDANGTASLQVSATDSQGANVQTLVNVTVAAVNDSPVALGTEAIAADLGVQAFSQYNLADLFEDLEDGNRLTYTIVGNSNPDILNDVEISGDNALLIIRYSPSLIGNAELVIRATDSEGAYVDSTVAVHVIDSTSIKTDMDTSGDSIAPPNYEETLVPSQTEDSTNTNPEVETPTNSTNVTELQNNPATPEENTQELDGSQRLQGREAFLSTTNTLNSSPNHSEMNDLLQAVIEKQREKQRLHENKIKLSQISPDAETPLISLIELDAENENDIFEFKKSFLHVKEDISEDDQTEQASKLISTGLTVSITTGLMVWSLRASSFLFTLFSMTPLWKGFDPLPIVTNERVLSERKKQRKDKKKEDRDSNEVGYMFDHTETGNQ